LFIGVAWLLGVCVRRVDTVFANKIGAELFISLPDMVAKCGCAWTCLAVLAVVGLLGDASASRSVRGVTLKGDGVPAKFHALAAAAEPAVGGNEQTSGSLFVPTTALPVAHTVPSSLGTHYGDPYKTPCEAGEVNATVTDVTGAICSPPCSGTTCPQDKPPGVTAEPACVFKVQCPYASRDLTYRLLLTFCVLPGITTVTRQ
jgi:hypothetical protein